MRIISSEEVERWLPWDVAIEAVSQGLKALSNTEVLMPVRSALRLTGDTWFGLMPAYLKYQDIIGAKLITVFPHNTDCGLPSHQGVVVLFSSSTGEALAIVDAEAITAIRTAAVSAVATNLLANRTVSQLAILGAGIQARTHIEALSQVRKFDHIFIWGPREERVHQLIAEMKERVAIPMHYAPSVEQAVREADVVCTVTASRTPLLWSSHVKNGAHINAVGASQKDARELASDLVQRSRIYVDSLESAWSEAGDLLIPLSEGRITREKVQCELGALLQDRDFSRASPDDVTIFKSLGLAVEDVAAAYAVYHNMKEGVDREP